MSDFVGENRASGQELNYKHCPVCGSDKWKLYVNPDTGRWYCFALQHGAGGSVNVAPGLSVLRDRWDAYKQSCAGHDTPAWPEVQLPSHRELSITALTYLVRRGISEEMIKDLRISEVVGMPYVLIPYFDDNNMIIYWVGRKYIQHLHAGHKYLAAHGSRPPYMPGGLRSVKRVVLVEGPMDAIKVWYTTGIPALAIGGTTVPHTMVDYIKRTVSDRIDIMLDGDATSKAIKLANKLRDMRGSSIVTHRLDASDDPDSMNPDSMREMLGV